MIAWLCHLLILCECRSKSATVILINRRHSPDYHSATLITAVNGCYITAVRRTAQCMTDYILSAVNPVVIKRIPFYAVHTNLNQYFYNIWPTGYFATRHYSSHLHTAATLPRGINSNAE